jgi:hypothetical protein
VITASHQREVRADIFEASVYVLVLLRLRDQWNELQLSGMKSALTSQCDIGFMFCLMLTIQCLSSSATFYWMEDDGSFGASKPVRSTTAVSISCWVFGAMFTIL